MASDSEESIPQASDAYVPPRMENSIEKMGCLESSNPISSTEMFEEPISGPRDTLTEDNYLKGWRLQSVTLSLCCAFFLSNYEVCVVSTSLIAITDALDGFSESGWIVTAYLLTYSAFLIIWAKMSDIFGRKLCIISTISIFVVFSGGCGASQTIKQLIVCRALQGIGGSGIFSLSSLMFFELGPPTSYATYTGLLSAVFALSYIVGPVFGGLINKSSTWRWIFLPNVPAGIVAILILMVAVPANFPNQGRAEKSRMRDAFSRHSLKRVDFLGATLLLAASLFLITALEEAGIEYAWNSPLIIVLLVLCGISGIAFAIWEYWISSSANVIEPMLPWKFLNDRVRTGLLLSMFLGGFPFTVAVLEIPQRFQAVNQTTALGAGIRLFGFIVASPVGAGISSTLAGKLKIPIVYLILFGSGLQVIGFTLLSRVSTSPISAIAASVYGFEVIAGLGVGSNLAILLMMAPFTIRQNERDILAVAVGAANQVRFLGGAIGFAIVTSVLDRYIKSQLSGVLTAVELTSLLESTAAINSFPADIAMVVRNVLGQGYNNQIKVLIGIAVAQFPAALLMWKREQIVA